jgi:hypothetical protein
MASEPDRTTLDALIGENQRLRRLAELLHDYFSPADSEQFPHHGEEICNVFVMDRAQQDAYWYTEARRALGLQTEECGSSWHEGIPREHSLFHIGAGVSGVH